MNIKKLAEAGWTGLLALALSGGATAEPPILAESMIRAVADYGTIRTAPRTHIEGARREQRFLRCAFPLR